MTFTIKGGGDYWKKRKTTSDGGMLPAYVSPKYLESHITDDVRESLLNPVIYKAKSGRQARGMKAELLPEICEIWIKAKEKGGIPESREKSAKIAELLMRGFARIGIIALVDEATGFQEVRDRQALHKILELFIAKELMPWTKTFPDEFYKELFRLKNWSYQPLSVKRPSVVGKITNDLVYNRLAEGVLDELKKKAPKTPQGRRKYHYHRWFTDDIGHPKLREHISNVITLMKASPSWAQFYRMIQRALPKKENTIEMLLESNNGEPI